MPYEAYISVKGTKQGQFKGEGIGRLNRGPWSPVLSFYMDVDSPRDAATGHASGKRQWKPVLIVKEWSAASPQALTALATNEVLTEVAIEFYRSNPQGTQVVYQRVKLTNASFVQVERFTGQQDGTLLMKPGPSETMELERWAFTFERIEVEDTDGKSTFIDDWGIGA